jgi:hypothetical protein
MMLDFKAYATRAIRLNDEPQVAAIKYWTRHGSTKYLWTQQSIDAAIKYVRDGQGKMMAFGATVQQSLEH